MDFARLWEQARELWARPVGKIIFGLVAVLILAAAAGTFFVTRPVYALLGTFSAEDAPKVAAQLNASKIPFKQTGSTGFSFQVREDQLNSARLVLAEISLDPTTSIWSPDLWKNRVSWSNTDFDKRRNFVEQIETNLTRSLMALSVIDRARVQISVPMERPVFKADEKPPKASVTVLPKKGQKLTPSEVEGIMELVANNVEGLTPQNVVVMDASTSQIVSKDLFKPKDSQQVQAEQRQDLMKIQQQVQEYWQNALTQQLEKVVGPGNVSVIVNPTINWSKVLTEAQDYKGAAPNGQGVVVSQQTAKETSEGGSSGAATPLPAGTPSNVETQSPTYPGAGSTASGSLSSEKSSQIINYLVNQVKTTTEQPGGAIAEISVGILVNSSRVVDAALEKKMNDVVTVAMGTEAQGHVQVAAMPFAEDMMKALTGDLSQPKPVAAAPDWLWWVLGVALGLGGIGLFFLATKPRRPVLEPVFAGPEAAMMGGIPVTEVEMPPPTAAAVQAPGAVDLHESTVPLEKRLPESAEEVAMLPPEEIAALADDFLIKLGVDPAKVRMKEKVERIAKVQPEQVANLLRSWISSEE